MGLEVNPSPSPHSSLDLTDCLRHTVKGSNEDFVGIFALPTERCLSLVPHPQKVDEEGGVDAKLNETYTRGLLLLELGLAMALLSKGNHRLIEAVFYDGPTQYSTVFWQQVKEQRAAFVTKTLVNHYLGVAKYVLCVCVCVC